MSKDRTAGTYIDVCLQVMEDATVTVAELGMAYRAWTGEEALTDVQVAWRLIDVAPDGQFRLATFGGSRWLIGAQLSGIGYDMVSEGMLGTLDEGFAG